MMMRAIVLLTILTASQAAPAATAKEAAPLKKEALKLKAVVKAPTVQLSAEQKKTMHWGCVSACKPSPVESKCVTACEAASYRCIDETGPGETPKDTKKCQDGVLKLYEETKGLKKEEKKKDGKKAAKKGGKKDAKTSDKKAEKKKAKSLLQVVRDDDDSLSNELSEEAEESTEADVEADSSDENNNDESDKANDEKSQDAEEEESSNEEDGGEEESTPDAESLVQVSRGGDDDDSTEETEGGNDDTISASMDANDEDEEDKAEEEAARSGADEEQSQDGGDDSTSKDDVADEGNDEAAAEENNNDEELLQATWKPEPCGELEPGVPCTHLYEHPQGSTVVMPCPVDQQANPEACGALFGNKADGEQCSQITCPKALGVTMKLICGGGCCPSCWAPDHVIKVDRHTSVDDAAVVDPAPQAASTCGGVKCFKTTCAAGFTEGFVNGSCCYSCVPGR